MIDVQDLIKIAEKAGEEVMRIYTDSTSDLEIQQKEDDLPVTKADFASNKILVEELTKKYPTIPIMSEEITQIAYDKRKDWKTYFCIDPLDGTKEFIKRNGEFTILISVIENNKPTIGVIYLPTEKKVYWCVKSKGSYVQKGSTIQKLPLQEEASDTVICSRSHMTKQTKKLIEEKGYSRIISAGSALKFCLVAQGKAASYIRDVPTMEWDTACGELLCAEVGKKIQSLDPNRKWEYNKENLRNQGFIVE